MFLVEITPMLMPSETTKKLGLVHASSVCLFVCVIRRPDHCADCGVVKTHGIGFAFEHFEGVRVHVAQYR
jgi:hypothetical protein